jgi:hypothetical protein
VIRFAERIPSVVPVTAWLILHWQPGGQRPRMREPRHQRMAGLSAVLAVLAARTPSPGCCGYVKRLAWPALACPQGGAPAGLPAPRACRVLALALDPG